MKASAWLGIWVGAAIGGYQVFGVSIAFVCAFFGIAPAVVYFLATRE